MEGGGSAAVGMNAKDSKAVIAIAKIKNVDLKKHPLVPIEQEDIEWKLSKKHRIDMVSFVYYINYWNSN